MVNDTTISVRGWAGADPMFFHNVDGATGQDIKVPTAIVNVGVTGRFFNRREQAWENAPTTWYSVRCFGALARNVKTSVHKGAPLLVRGKFATKQYVDKHGVERTDIQILADSIGVDLNSMVVTYSKMPRADMPSVDKSHTDMSHTVDLPHADLPCVDMGEESYAGSPSTVKEAPMESVPAVF